MRHFAANIITMSDSRNHPAGLVCASLDITERKHAEEQIAEYAEEVSNQRAALLEMNRRLNDLATTDELTGLSNRRQFREILIAALAARNGKPLSLLLMDLDHFKRVNDAEGHLAGDEVLRQFAGILRSISTGIEVLARYGGEEFAILVPDSGPEAAVELGERFRRAIAEYPWRSVPVTVSIGVATAEADQITSDELIGRADTALYAAKDAGRNQVRAAINSRWI